MKVLVVGGGGREHALVWKIAQSKRVRHIYCAPGNAGIADQATCVAINAEDIEALLAFAQKEQIDLTVVGPEAPLANGIVDIFEDAGLKVFGASKLAAELEASKSFAKKLMHKYNVPTAKGQTFCDIDEAIAYVEQVGAPVVVKADGLAAGKGVIVCPDKAAALEALDNIMNRKSFGNAGDKVVIEECLIGEEASFLAFTDGHTVVPLPSSQDHKAIFENDKGPNTGGMGAYSPAPIVDDYMHKKIMNEVMIPVVRAMAQEGRPYKGILYAGLMIDSGKINVLEFNARFGDPEAQPLLMRIQSDIVPILMATIDGTLDQIQLAIDPRAAMCVVMAAEGYPGSYMKGKPISGIEAANQLGDAFVFHAGTALEDNRTVTSGGRVLGVTALGDGVAQAIEKAYQAVAKIAWEGAYFRRDIGQKALTRLETRPLVGIVLGSDSDLKVMEETVAVLKQFDIPYELTIASAHRSPRRAAEYASTARERGLKVIIAAAGLAAHLAGTLATHTILPVIGVPINAALNGLDSLLATVQMPPGIPVATVAIGKPGATNAGILAVQIIGNSMVEIQTKLEQYKTQLAEKVEQKANRLKVAL